jgi:hypothetical protein
MTTTFYGTTGDADAYHLERANTDWAGADAATKTAALLIASEWIDTKYRQLFPGLKVGLRSQTREWPRTGAYDCEGNTITNSEIPIEVQNATYEVALRQVSAPGSLNTDYVAGENVKSVSVSGAVAISYGAGAMSALDVQLDIPQVDRILAPILTGSPTSNLSGSSTRV